MTRFIQFLLLLLYFGLATTTFGSVVCRLSYIAGYIEEAEAAKKFLRPKTSNIEKLDILLCVRRGTLYIHSNFLTSGFNYPTKMTLGSEFCDQDEISFERIILNIISIEPGPDVEAVMLKALSHLNLYVDSSVNQSNWRFLVSDPMVKTVHHIHLSVPDLPVVEPIPELDQTGTYVLKVPSTCQVGDSFIAEIYVAKDSSLLKTYEADTRTMSLAGLGIDDHDFVQVHCICATGCIEFTPSIHEVKQEINNENPSIWYFNAKTVRSGEHTVQLALEVVDQDGKATMRTLDKFEITVTPDRAAFWRNNWRYMLSTLILPAFSGMWIWWRKHRPKRRQQEEESPKIIA